MTAHSKSGPNDPWEWSYSRERSSSAAFRKVMEEARRMQQEVRRGAEPAVPCGCGQKARIVRFTTLTRAHSDSIGAHFLVRYYHAKCECGWRTGDYILPHQAGRAWDAGRRFKIIEPEEVNRWDKQSRAAHAIALIPTRAATLISE